MSWRYAQFLFDLQAGQKISKGKQVKNEQPNKGTKSPWYKRWTADFAASTVGWTLAEIGGYDKLLDASWQSDGLPADPKRIFLIHGEIESVWKLLADKFPIAADGKRRNPRQERERAEMLGVSLTRSAIGSMGGKQRASNAQAIAIANTQANTQANSNHSDSDSDSDAESQTETDSNNTTDSLEPRTKRARRQVVGITWDAVSGWQNVTDSHKITWRVAYPNCSVDTSLARMHMWLLANPTKAHKTNWLRFITSWFARTREDGGNLPPVQRPTESNF